MFICVNLWPHFVMIAMDPAVQTSSSNSGSRSSRVRTTAIALGAAAVNGSPICSITIGTESAGAVRQLTLLPAATNTAIGTRNFIDAANHTQYRVCAALPFSASTSSHATTANSVDCHK